MSRIFIERPIFAWVLAIITMLAGIGALTHMPIAQYPDVAPPQVAIRATYPGASAETLENSVTQVIEQQLTGLDGLLYFSSSSTSRGEVTITVTFEKGVNPDIAQVQVQNKVQQAVSRLPQQVQQQGLRVTKSTPDFLLVVSLYDTSGRRNGLDVADYLTSYMQDRLSRIPGIGDSNLFGAQYAMRIWLDPHKLASFGLMPGDVISAVQAQNNEVAAGEIGGQPMPPTQMLNATVTAQSRLRNADQFRAIILKTERNGAAVRLGDVARVELGGENYNTLSRVNGNPSAGLALMLAPGADALKTAKLVKAEVAKIAETLPSGMHYTFTNDSTDFIQQSIREVVETLIEAIILVVIVMFIFLQGWRATLVPAIAVPVVLLGTFAVLYAAGFSINTLTLFGLVLAIGLLVDDAIVVVENVERLLEENPGMTPREATIRSMDEIQVALVAIALVLSAVFLPMAFFGGSTGVIYRQFSVTIIAAMVLSVFVALILSPALTANLLKAKVHGEGGAENPVPARGLVGRATAVGASFNRFFDRLSTSYSEGVRQVVASKWLYLAGYVLIAVMLAVLFLRLPTSFLPTEDQGLAMTQFQLPAGATQGRTFEVQKAVERYFLHEEKKNVRLLFSISGGFGPGTAQNTGRGFIKLYDASLRPGAENTADAITRRANKAFSALRDARVYVLVQPSLRGLGQSNGFTMELQNDGSLTRAQFAAARDQLLAAARADPSLEAVRLTELPDVQSLNVDMDHEKLSALGLRQDDVNATLATAWGGRYINDFIDRGRVKRVYAQGDAPFRAAPSDLDQWFVRGSDGQMIPFSAFARTGWGLAPTNLSRFQGMPSFEFQGQAAAGFSSGQAMDRMEELARSIRGTTVAWSGLSFQERLSSGQAPALYALSLLVVFLCLAALYESWSIPVAVLLVIPLGLVGAVLAVTLRGLENDVYLQIGLLTTMGLTAKNAILVIEFAEKAERQGMRILDAAVSAARIRLRPILMTSLAFMFGVLPLAVATGSGANSRIAIGTAVIGGMLTATALAIFYIPLFFVLIRRGVRTAGLKLRGRWPAMASGSGEVQ
jgi:multidrug efflux pump